MVKFGKRKFKSSSGGVGINQEIWQWKYCKITERQPFLFWKLLQWSKQCLKNLTNLKPKDGDSKLNTALICETSWGLWNDCLKFKLKHAGLLSVGYVRCKEVKTRRSDRSLPGGVSHITVGNTVPLTLPTPDHCSLFGGDSVQLGGKLLASSVDGRVAGTCYWVQHRSRNCDVT